MSPSTAGQRIVFDITTVCRSQGHATGIVRVEREFAKWALQNLRNAVFVFFDPEAQCYRRVKEEWIERLFRGEIVIDARSLPRAQTERRHILDRLPRRFRRGSKWILQLRRKLLMSLELVRLKTQNPTVAGRVERIQKSIMSEKYRQWLFQPDGTRRPFLEVDTILGVPHEFLPTDILVCVGLVWDQVNLQPIAEARRRNGLRIVLLCHDIIPLQLPHLCVPSNVDAFRDWFYRVVPVCDLIITATHQVEKDVLEYCAEHNLPVKKTAVTAFGADGARGGGGRDTVVRLGLEPGRYILFVSTIDPRKGHRFLLRVWKQLLKAGIPQRENTKLVLAGRIGWMVDDLVVELKQLGAKTGSLMLLPDINDDALGALYESAAFCVFPSEYEGFGLPLIEAFQHGKAVIASTGGAVPEVVGDFSPCLDPHDEAAWTEMLGSWIADADLRRPYEVAIRARFRHPTWEEASKQFFETVVSNSSRPQ